MSTKSKIAHTFTHMGLKVNLYKADEHGESNMAMSMPLMKAWLNHEPNLEEIGEVRVSGWGYSRVVDLKSHLADFLYENLAMYRFQRDIPEGTEFQECICPDCSDKVQEHEGVQ